MFLFLVNSNFAWGQLSVLLPKDSNQYHNLVKKTLIGNGILVGNFKIVAAKGSIANFKLNTKQNLVKEGIVLSTGQTMQLLSPNDTTSVSNANKMPGDKDLSNLIGRLTGDAVSIEFDFIPLTDTIAFKYFFGSEEYPEYVGKGFNDAFAFLISGPGYPLKYNMARLKIGSKEIPITIDNINFINNPDLFISNHLETDKNKLSRSWRKILSQPLMLNEIELDGMTTRLIASARVIPNEVYTLKIVIADVGDLLYDSAVFLEKESFGSTPAAILPNKIDTQLLVQKFEKLYKDDSVKLNSIYKEYPKTAYQIQYIQDTFQRNIYYKTDSFELNFTQKNELKRWIDSLEKNSSLIYTIVTGHTDNSGSYNYNLLLSKKRSNAVIKYLKNIDVPVNHSIWKAYNAPIVPNTDEKGKAKNRRTEITIICKKAIKTPK